jgi:hypothetical protein
MELRNNEVIFSRKERKVLGLTARQLATTALESFWSGLAQRTQQEIESLKSTPLRDVPQLACPWQCVGVASNSDFIQYNLRQLHKTQDVMQELSHEVAAIVQETLPVNAEQIQ